MAHDARRLSEMSIKDLMTAADAAGYVMVSEEELPEAFGRTPSLFDFKSVPSTAVAIWRPVVPSIDGKPVSVQRSTSDLWHWVTSRFATGATA